MNQNLSTDKRASETAMMAAAHRHLSLFESNPDFRTQDILAKLFVPGLGRFWLGFAWVRRYLLKKLHKKVPGTYPYVIARTQYFDEKFIQALKTSVPQIVLLGAGYDTRASRYKEQNQASTIFELDTPALLEKKKAIFNRNNIVIPDHLKLSPITFGQDDLTRVLKQAGFDPALKTLFMWEGVTYYLPESAVIETLSFVQKSAATESTLVFDYFYRSFIDGNHDYYGAREIFKAVEEVGEPFKFGIAPERLEMFLAEFGFELSSHDTPAELEKHYLTSDGDLLGKVYGFVECVTAIRT